MKWIVKTSAIIAVLTLWLMPLTGCIQQKNDTAQEAKNVEIVMEMFKDIAEKKNLDKIDSYFAPNFVMVSNNTERNLDEFKKHTDQMLANSSAVKMSDMVDIFAQGDKVAERYTITVTDKKNNKQEFDGISIFQLKDNKIVKWWDVSMVKEKKKH